MGNSPIRNPLFCSAAMLSLLAALYIPVSLAEENHSDHGRHAVDSSKAASEKQPPQVRGQGPANQQMDHGSMNHEGMDHQKMTGEHGSDHAEADSNHDH
ncbi:MULTISPECIES: hypothetical protein [Stutzerimonas]|uniref:hypothetical protein n=1 Tax=Stutzerimonas TaxID=2901164 RepID=UPI0009BC0738|nr:MULTISPECIES: hypothetical protein [Stutzerimonas]HAB63006.1 hypothetical protein [Pseudomonas sp.]MBD3877904.1 hypothetical protein [Stutzerimonas kunmingensis]MBK3806137.1 hypothetical protein [Stutzerimonas stutzeri]MBK3853400.1 hypothetical protein [Stutzerimonas stutzeri]MCF6759107.1 hypothetical protein [Stutzerimonas balearica]